MTDHTDLITHVFTAVFPSTKVIDCIIKSGIENALLFLHHPMCCDLARVPIFYDISPEDHERLRAQRISIYVLHTPLDNNSSFGTSVNLARMMNIDLCGEIYPYFGHYVGVIGKTGLSSVRELSEFFSETVGHKTQIYPYGPDTIKDGLVGIVAGGGNVASIYRELQQRGVQVHITGIGNMRTGYKPAVEAHRAAKELGISILTGTHYSTEKFACMKMVGYFSALELPSEFLEDEASFVDM